MQELFLLGLASQVDNLMEAVITSKSEVLEKLEEMKAKNTNLETELVKTKVELSEVKSAIQKSNNFSSNVQHDSEAMLKNIAVRCKKLEDTATKLSEHKEKDKKDVIGQKERVKNNVIEINDGSGRQNRSGKHRVTWIGTSLSKVLNRKKFEDDINVELHTVKAYCINKEGRFPECNFEDMVPKVVSEDNTNTLVLQTGSIEITNIDVNNAMMDPSKNIEKYKEEWFEKVEEASNKLFKIAEDAIEKSSQHECSYCKETSKI